MPLASEPDRCTQVRYVSVINTAIVTDDCFSSLSPRCSLSVLQLYIHVHDNSEVQNGCDIGSRENRLLKTHWFEDDEGLRLRTIRRWLRCVFFSIWTMDHRTRLVPIATTIDGPPALDLTDVGGCILVFDVPSPKCFAQPGDRHSCQGSNTGSLEKKKENFQILLVVVVGVRKKMPGDGAEFSQRPPRHRRTRKPQSLKVWRQIFQKRGKPKNSSKRSYL